MQNSYNDHVNDLNDLIDKIYSALITLFGIIILYNLYECSVYFNLL